MKIENIKFKAKRLDGKGWVCGYFYEENGNTYIIENRQSESMLNRNITYLVDPSTVCQFTGLKDCEGNEVWEGDIVEHEIWNRLYNGFIKVKGIIEYKGYEFVVATNSETYSLYSKHIKVVGNKFDKEYRTKSIFSMFAYWDRVHQFPDGHIKVKNNLAWRRKHLHFSSSNKKIPF